MSESQILNRPGAYRIYLILAVIASFLFSMIFTASSLYQVTVARLTPLQLVLVGTMLELSVFLFEIPTGVVADVFSRRLSIIIGYFLIGLGFILEGSVPLFWSIMIAQVLWGVGYTFTSGATQAWISDEIGEAAANRAFLRSEQLGQAAALLGIAAGMVIGSLRINLPIQLGGFALILLALFLVLRMPETGFKPAPQADRNTWQKMGHTFVEGLKTMKRRPALITILTIGLFFGLYSEGFDRLWTKHILETFAFPTIGNFQPVVWIGLMRGVGMLLSIGAAEVAIRRVDTHNHSAVARALFGITTALIGSLLTFAMAGRLALVLVAYWVIYVTRSVINPLYTAWVNQRLDSSVRATVISMSSQVDAIGQVAGGPVVGLVGNTVSVTAAITLSGLLLTPVLPLFARTIKRDTRNSSENEKSPNNPPEDGQTQ
jgi:DHA3 family tetracycline resistance protein-like MFS transporter